MRAYFAAVAADHRIVSVSSTMGHAMPQGAPGASFVQPISAEHYVMLTRALNAEGRTAYWSASGPVLAHEWEVSGLPAVGTALIPGSTLTLTWTHPFARIRIALNWEEHDETSPLEIIVPDSGRLLVEVTDPRVAPLKRAYYIQQEGAVA